MRDHAGRTRWVVVAAAAMALALVAAGLRLAPPAAGAGTTLRALADAKGIKIGTAVAADHLSADAPYASIAAAQFNSVTPENEMKWSSVEPSQGSFNWAPADQIVSFAQANGQRVRGHNLVWDSQLPGWVTGGGFSAAQLQSLMTQHIATEAGRFAGKVASWDVVNEPLNGDGSLKTDLWQQAFATSATDPAYVAAALRAARQADAGAKLFLNDFNIEGVNAKSTAMLNLMTSLKQQGVPIDGVGLESHLIVGQVPSSLQQNIARFVAAGFTVEITELDDRFTSLPPTSAGLAQQATDYGAVVQACLAVAGCTGVTVWEYTDKYSWVPGAFSGQGAADLYDANLATKPAYDAVVKALGGTVVSPSPSPSASPSAAPSPSPSPSASPSASPGGCRVTYAMVNQWNVGFQVNLTIANTGTSTINGWTLAWTFPNGQALTNSWSGQFTQSGANVTVANLSWNATLAPGGSANPGFTASWAGANNPPASFTLNGVRCATG